jgi:hypothetical protein
MSEELAQVYDAAFTHMSVRNPNDPSSKSDVSPEFPKSAEPEHLQSLGML